MKLKTISRRNFLKTTVAYSVMTQYFPAVAFAKNIESVTRLDTDSEFIVVNNWVLLKSDISLGNGK